MELKLIHELRLVSSDVDGEMHAKPKILTPHKRQKE